MSISASASKFFIELPGDEHWNTLHTRGVVIEAQEQPINKWQHVVLTVLAPESFASRWPTVNKSDFIECSGPARKLDTKEYVRFIHAIEPRIPLPKRWTDHTTKQLKKLNHPNLVSPLPSPSEPNPNEQAWQVHRDAHLPSRFYEDYNTIDVCCDAWNAFVNTLNSIKNISLRLWANL